MQIRDELNPCSRFTESNLSVLLIVVAQRAEKTSVSSAATVAAIMSLINSAPDHSADTYNVTVARRKRRFREGNLMISSLTHMLR